MTKDKTIEEIIKKCKKLAGGVNTNFLGYVFGSVMDYGNENGGLMSVRAFNQKFARIIDRCYTPKSQRQTECEKYAQEFLKYMDENRPHSWACDHKKGVCVCNGKDFMEGAYEFLENFKKEQREHE